MQVALPPARCLPRLFFRYKTGSVIMDATQAKSLFEQLGGRAAVDAAVEKFYARLLNDNRVNFFFEGVDMARQRAKQKAFMTYAFGGAPNYSGLSMRKAHEKLVRDKGLNDSHFDIVAGHLMATLDELGVPAALSSQVMAIVGSTRDDVLNR